MFLAGGLIAGGALVALDDPMHPALGEVLWFGAMAAVLYGIVNDLPWPIKVRAVAVVPSLWSRRGYGSKVLGEPTFASQPSPRHKLESGTAVGLCRCGWSFMNDGQWEARTASFGHTVLLPASVMKNDLVQRLAEAEGAQVVPDSKVTAYEQTPPMPTTGPFTEHRDFYIFDAR